MANPLYLVGSEISTLLLLPCYCICSILLQLSLTCFKLLFLEVAVSGECDVSNGSQEVVKFTFKPTGKC